MTSAATMHDRPQSRATMTLQRLRWFNAAMAVLHLAQGIAILALSEAVEVPITSAFLVLDKQTQLLIPQANTLFDLPLAPLVASFVFISAFAHTLVALPGVHGWYARNLERRINYVRWWEYALSASVMIMLIALLTGMWDLGSLILIFALNAMMLLFGLIMEMFSRQGGRVNWTPYWFGCIAGTVTWIVIALYLFSPGTSGGDPPGFVYGIFVSLFLLFNLFAVNMWLQYRRIGPWRNYLFGEAAYIVLSLTAKSALAWQVFFGTLNAPID